jgi:hypothetical protein
VSHSHNAINIHNADFLLFQLYAYSYSPNIPKKPRDEEDMLAKALHAYDAREFSSLRKAADHYRVSYSKLRGRKNGRPSLSDRPTTNNALDSNQENALISWIEVLNSCYTPPTAKEIEIAANCLLKIAGSERVVSSMYNVFCKRVVHVSEWCTHPFYLQLLLNFFNHNANSLNLKLFRPL